MRNRRFCGKIVLYVFGYEFFLEDGFCYFW